MSQAAGDGVVASGRRAGGRRRGGAPARGGRRRCLQRRRAALRPRAGRTPARRLAARLAAKRAACRLLGGGASESEVEVVRAEYGPPALRLSGRRAGEDAGARRFPGPGEPHPRARPTPGRWCSSCGTPGEARDPPRAPAPRGGARRRRRARLPRLVPGGGHGPPPRSTTTATRCGWSTAGSSAATPRRRWRPSSRGSAPAASRTRTRTSSPSTPRAASPPTTASRCGRSSPPPAASPPSCACCPGSAACARATGGRRPGTIELADLTQRQRLVAEARGLVDEGFDGVHLNVEPVDDGNDEFLALLRALRTAVGPGHVLSIAAIRPAPGGPAPRAQLRLEPRLLRPGGRDRRPDRDHGLRHRAADARVLPPLRALGRPLGGGGPRRLRLRRAGADGDTDLRALRLHAPLRGRDRRRTRSPGSWRACAASAPAAPSRASPSTRSGRPTRPSGPRTSATGGTGRSEPRAPSPGRPDEVGAGELVEGNEVVVHLGPLRQRRRGAAFSMKSETSLMRARPR